MAQTTDGMSFKDCKIETSANGSSWTDISGFANSLDVSGGERKLEETFTYSGDVPILTAGKRGALEVKVKAVYTEGASDPTEVVRAAYEGGTSLYVRWSPKGGTTGQFQYATAAGKVTTPVYPKGDAESAAAVMIEFTLKTPSVTKAAVS